MKLGDIILKEAPLASYGRNYAGPRLGPTNPGDPNGETVKQLKAALSKHQIYIPGQKPNPSQVAWIGDNTGEWTQALSDAIIAWKKSINAQDESAKLDTRTPELSPRAISYLLDKKLYTTTTNKGLLVTTGGDAESTGTTAPWKGATLDLSYVINTPTSDIKTVKDFLAAIGFSGWSMILSELVNKKDYVTSSKRAELQKSMKELYVQQNSSPVLWLQSWEDNVLKEDGENLKATLANGNEIPFHPLRSPGFDTTWKSIEKGSQRLYDYFRVLGNGLLRKAQEEYRQSKQKEQNKKQVDDTPSLSGQAITVWSRKMNNALEFGFIDRVDEDSVSTLMAELKSAGDWDKVAAQYKQEYKLELSAELVKKLSDDDYEAYVVRNLARINRINPNALASSIKFGNTQDSIQVEYENSTYTVMKAQQNGKVIVKKRNQEIKDVIVVDAILRIAITQSGGAVPDFNIEITDDSLMAAGNLVLLAVQTTADFMTPYYTAQSPFDKSVAPNMGPMRLVGLQEQAAKLLQNGLSDTAVLDWIAREVRNDAEWLISTETVHFDERWADSENSQLLTKLNGILDPKDVTDEEKDLIDRLHREETREEAAAEIVNSNDPAGFYERIYRAFIIEKDGESFDIRALGSKATTEIRKFVIDGTPISDNGLGGIINRIGVAKAAPVTMAKLYKESMKGPEWWSVLGGTDEELGIALTQTLMDREDYLLINEYYKQPPVNGSNDLIDDLDAEYFNIFGDDKIVARIKEAIGEQTSSIARANLDAELQRVLSNLEQEPNLDNLNTVVSALRRPNNNYFTVIKDKKPTKMLDQEKIATVFTFLYKLANESGNIYNDEQKSLFFDILNAMDKEIERIYNLQSPPMSANAMPYNMWKGGFRPAQDKWFEE